MSLFYFTLLCAVYQNGFRSIEWLCSLFISKHVRVPSHFSGNQWHLEKATGCWTKWGMIRALNIQARCLHRPTHTTSSCEDTPIHTLSLQPHTHFYTLLHTSTHEDFGSLHITNAHTTSTVQDGGVLEKKEEKEGASVWQSLIFSHADPGADPDKAGSHF